MISLKNSIIPINENVSLSFNSQEYYEKKHYIIEYAHILREPNYDNINNDYLFHINDTYGNKIEDVQYDPAFKGKIVIQLTDEPGILSRVLDEIAEFNVNILTIHQSVPVGGSASLTLSVKIPETGVDYAELVSAMENVEGVHYVKILARE